MLSFRLHLMDLGTPPLTQFTVMVGVDGGEKFIRLGTQMVRMNQKDRKWPFPNKNHMATVYCPGSQKLENLNLHIDLCHFWIILTTYKWSKELAAQNYIFTPFGGLFVTMYTKNHGPIKFLIKLQEVNPT